MKTLILLGRPGCGLCEQLEEALHQRFAGRFRLDWRDVDREPRWRAEYGARIPVLLDAGGRLLCATRLDAAALEPYLLPSGGPV